MKRNFTRLVRYCIYNLKDFRYGGKFLMGKCFKGNDAKGWHGSQNSDYCALEKIFSVINIKEDDVIVDVGCGKGRLFNWLLTKKIKNKLIGIDVDPSTAEFTKQRLGKYPQIEIFITDVEKGEIPIAGTIFYLFNPFDDKIVKKFSDLLAERVKIGSYKDGDRPLIVYYNCNRRLSIFSENPIWKIRNLGIVSHTGLDAAIIEPA